MAANLNDLDAEFRYGIQVTYDQCLARGFLFRPNFTSRSPWAQARLWRQSRTAEEIKAAIEHLVDAKADYLAFVLNRVGPQHGQWATNALPGLSWHNFKPAVACDSCNVVEGAANWKEGPAYQALREEAGKRGITNLARIHDYGHLQKYPQEIPQLYPLREISEQMEKMWGYTE